MTRTEINELKRLLERYADEAISLGASRDNMDIVGNGNRIKKALFEIQEVEHYKKVNK